MDVLKKIPPPNMDTSFVANIILQIGVYFINHKNPPFLFLDTPFIQIHPLYQWNPVSHPPANFQNF